MRKTLYALFSVFALSSAAQSESGLWLGADVDYALTSRWSTELSLGARLEDGFSTFTRYDAALGFDYKAARWLKLGAGYDFIRDYSGGELEERFKASDVRPGTYYFNGYNVTDAYWRTKHRAYFDITEKWKLGRFAFSLRERYQYTHYAPVENVERKYREEYDEGEYDRLIKGGASPADFMPRIDEEGDLYYYRLKSVGSKSAKDKHYLRTRLAIDYNIRRCPVTPFASYESAFDLGDAFSIVRHRVTAGIDWTLTRNKRHALSIAYLYQHGAQEETGAADLHIISLGYKFSLESARAAAQKKAKKKAKK